MHKLNLLQTLGLLSALGRATPVLRSYNDTLSSRQLSEAPVAEPTFISQPISVIPEPTIVPQPITVVPESSLGPAPVSSVGPGPAPVSSARRAPEPSLESEPVSPVQTTQVLQPSATPTTIEPTTPASVPPEQSSATIAPAPIPPEQPSQTIAPTPQSTT